MTGDFFIIENTVSDEDSQNRDDMVTEITLREAYDILGDSNEHTQNWTPGQTVLIGDKIYRIV